jgi:hypothetical protein
LLLGVPEREREHAVEALDAGGPPLAIGVQDHLGVGARVEDVAELLQVGHQLDVVVDLPVVGDPIPLRAVVHRLTAALGEVDDREPAVHEAAGDGVRDGRARLVPVRRAIAGGEEDATFAVRAAVALDGAHANETIDLDRLAAEVDHSSDTAHPSQLSEAVRSASSLTGRSANRYARSMRC